MPRPAPSGSVESSGAAVAYFEVSSSQGARDTVRRHLIYGFFVLGATCAVYVGTARAFAATSPVDISSILLSTAALTSGLFLFGATALRLNPDREGWGLRLSDGKR